MRRLSLAILLASSLTACSRFSEPAEFTVVNGAEPQTLDPAIISGQPEGRVVNALFEGLLARNAKGELIPGVAESWEISEDGKTYTFRLRQDARWSNGDPVIAQDFEKSWERVLNPVTGSVYSELLFFIEGAEDYLKKEPRDWNKVGVKSLIQIWKRLDILKSSHS